MEHTGDAQGSRSIRALSKRRNFLRAGKPLTGTDGIFTPLIKQVPEASLEGELDAHLIRKAFRGEPAQRISTPRDRHGSFAPRTIEKRQRQLPGDLEDKIIGLYGLDMSYVIYEPIYRRCMEYRSAMEWSMLN